ncbi:uncharacterized protein LOC129180386 [Dunckerocampus dactyliophorus]|uniref:uncharacterized protein LOC129180386 n=1 Tax=Dunckerocampus dactyliophorus TaxID=161453 RepID=UPI002406C7C3|nr:uncharacterized protein LOC129180386 [Dunckerocampus dactyliophorus]
MKCEVLLFLGRCVSQPPVTQHIFEGATCSSLPDISVLCGGLLSSAMSAQLLVVLLAFTALCAASSEPDCKDLVKPLLLDDHSPVFGKWVLHVGSWDEPGLKSDLVVVNTSWIELSPSSQTGVISLYWADRLTDDKCLQGSADVTVTGMTSHATFNINNHTSYHEGKYYETCADCLFSEDTTLLPDGKSLGRYLFLFTRTGQLEPSELETFKKQAACLNFPAEYYFMGTNLCPDSRKTEPPASTN